MIKPDATATKEYKLVPEGTHVARCYSIIHIGHVPNTYPGATNPTVNTIRITWEFPELTEVFRSGEDARPYVISKEYTLSMNEKANLYKVVCSWLGKKLTEEEGINFDVESLIGQACLLNIAHITKNIAGAERTFAAVNTIVKLPTSFQAPEAVNDPKVVSWDTMEVDTFNKLPPFIQDKMKTATEYIEWSKKFGSGDIEYPEERVNAESIPF